MGVDSILEEENNQEVEDQTLGHKMKQVKSQSRMTIIEVNLGEEGPNLEVDL